jgi:branched-chain amino acid transport system substrate-binding protein
MNTRLLIQGACLLFSLGLAAAGHAQTAKKPEFRLGVVLAASGGASSIGLPERSAVTLAEETLAKADLPFTIKFVSYDDASDPTKTTNAVKRLVEEDQVHFVICCTTTPSSLGILPTLTASKTPSMTLAAAVSAVEPVAERRFVFKASATDKMMIERLLDDAKARKAKRIASIFADDSYGESGLVALKALAPGAGIELGPVERVARTDTNFTPQALRIRQSNPDLVYVHTYTPASYLMQEALRRVGYTGTVIQSQGSASAAFLSLGGAALDGTQVIVSPVVVHSQLAAGFTGKVALDEFVKQYEGKYGAGKADNYSAMGWDAVYIAVEAFRQALAKGVDTGNVAATRAAMLQTLEGMRGAVGTSGAIQFTPDDHVGLDRKVALPMSEVRGGKFVLVK